MPLPFTLIPYLLVLPLIFHHSLSSPPQSFSSQNLPQTMPEKDMKAEGSDTHHGADYNDPAGDVG